MVPARDVHVLEGPSARRPLLLTIAMVSAAKRPKLWDPDVKREVRVRVQFAGAVILFTKSVSEFFAQRCIEVSEIVETLEMQYVLPVQMCDVIANTGLHLHFNHKLE